MDFRVLYAIITALVLVSAIGYLGIAYAQNETEVVVTEPNIEIGGNEIAIVIIGALGGLTSAYLGYRKNHTKGDTFDVTKFFDRVIMAVITSIGLAIASAANLLVLDLFTMYLIFVSALGTSELVMELRHRNASKPK